MCESNANRDISVCVFMRVCVSGWMDAYMHVLCEWVGGCIHVCVVCV